MGPCHELQYLAPHVAATVCSKAQAYENSYMHSQEDFCMGAVSGAFAAAATTPLDVIKTRMMCTAATRPSMRGAAGKVWAQV